jgi:hypothetical protein
MATGSGAALSSTGGVNDAVANGCAISLGGRLLAQAISAATDEDAAAGTLADDSGAADWDGPPPPPHAARACAQSTMPVALARVLPLDFMFISFVIGVYWDPGNGSRRYGKLASKNVSST